jgi:addiction module RelB/DinJ family antitoxin
MKTMLNIKTDSKLKKEAQKIAKEMGLSMSVLVNQGLRKLVETRSVTFQAPLVPNAKTGRELKKTMAEIKAGKHKKWPTFDTMKETTDYLHS